MIKEIEKIKIGFCCNCDRQILDLTQQNPRRRALPIYREQYIKLSNNSLMRIALCRDCDENMDKTKAEHIMKRHRQHWKEEIEESIVIPEDKKPEALARNKVLKCVEVKVNNNQFLKKKRNV